MKITELPNWCYPKKKFTNLKKVPYGRKFQSDLSDGTKVFLNAGRVLSFPLNYSDMDRTVFLLVSFF